MNDGVRGGGPGLALRILLLLTLALLPLGAISVWQDQRLIEQLERSDELTLLARTEQAANPVQDVVQRALGATEAIAAVLPELLEDDADCIAFLEAFVEARPEYSLAAVLQPDGMMNCASNGRTFDFSDHPDFVDSLARPRDRVTVNPNAPISEEAVLIVTHPAVVGREVQGFISISVPVDGMDAQLGARMIGAGRPVGLITANAEGTILTSSFPVEEIDDQLPAQLSVADLVAGGQRIRRAETAAGETRTYAVATLVPGAAYAIGSWTGEATEIGRIDRLVSSGIMPLLMFAASIAVAVLALERLVLRHVRTLSRQMRTFARTRRLAAQPKLGRAARELQEIEEDFREMASAIIQDEATLENNLREKNLLLKEVHHRVKNNLQLISSLINMEVRRVDAEESRGTLRRIQDRIMGLAMVHRQLYTSSELDRIDAGALVSQLAHQLTVSESTTRPPELEVEDGILLIPDQAVPLSLLVSEALTNALRHGEGRPRLRFGRTEEGEAELVVRNHLDDEEADPARDGLGSRLITAFAGQLEGALSTAREGGEHVVRLVFPIEGRQKVSRDY